MGHPVEKTARATYADIEAVPPGKLAELIHGEIHVFPRPAPAHLDTAGALLGEIRNPFHRGLRGPGGWWIFIEPEIHFPDPGAPKGIHAVVPDLAGFRRERMPAIPQTAYFSLAPNWVCEILSPSTATHDRKLKLPLYASHGVRFAWLIDPAAKTLEVYSLGDDHRWDTPVAHAGAQRVRAAPFEAIELDLSVLWTW
jgi:Uma2 family endonuclease